MEKEMELDDVIKVLAGSTESWNKVKTILEADIKSTQSLINFIDKTIKERENESMKLN